MLLQAAKLTESIDDDDEDGAKGDDGNHGNEYLDEHSTYERFEI